jgi:uncharacterized protein YjbJ (UPF0337 family)
LRAFAPPRDMASPALALSLSLPIHVQLKFTAMTDLNLKGNWNELKGKLKQKYGQLTDDDLIFAEGKDDEMWGRLQKKLGRTKEEIRKEIEKL